MIAVDKLSSAPINTLWLYLVLGAIFGAVGVGFNALIFRTQDMFARLHGGRMRNILLMGGLLGGVCGILGLIQPEAAGGGFGLIPIAAAGNYSVGMLMFIFITRIFTTLLCFGSGAPGGIFAPMLALGTLFGTAFGLAGRICSRSTASRRAPSPSPAWGTVRRHGARPLTGIVLVLEMTDNYQLILPMIITCLGATVVAQLLGGKPLYSSILARTLQRQEAQLAREAAEKTGKENTTNAVNT